MSFNVSAERFKRVLNSGFGLSEEEILNYFERALRGKNRWGKSVLSSTLLEKLIGYIEANPWEGGNQDVGYWYLDLIKAIEVSNTTFLEFLNAHPMIAKNMPDFVQRNLECYQQKRMGKKESKARCKSTKASASPDKNVLLTGGLAPLNLDPDPKHVHTMRSFTELAQTYNNHVDKERADAHERIYFGKGYAQCMKDILEVSTGIPRHARDLVLGLHALLKQRLEKGRAVNIAPEK